MEVDELGINELVQNIHFLSDYGDFEAFPWEFPWHNKMIFLQCEKIKKLVNDVSVEKRIDLVIGLFHIPGYPVRAVIRDCVKNINKETFLVGVMNKQMDEQYCRALTVNETTFLSEE